MFSFTVPGGGYRTIRCRLRKHHPHPETQAFGKNFDDIINLRRQEADQFYDKVRLKHSPTLNSVLFS